MSQLILLIASIIFIVVVTAKFKLHPFLALLIAAFGFGLISGMDPMKVVKSINDGFGGTIGYIGIVILAGTIIGVFLEKSGGAQSLAESTLKLTGEKNVPLAMGIIGYIVSMPVFCDSGFVLLSPLNKALSRKAKVSLAAGAIALSLGLYATHTMVPPTPGPIAAAGILEADLGRVILWGMIVSIVALIAGWLFAIKVASKVHLPFDEETVETAALPAGERPGAFKAIVPIILPIVLIVLQSIAKYPSKPFGEGAAVNWLIFFGQPVVALMIGVIFSLFLPRKLECKLLSGEGWIGEAVLSAATIIIITGSGGAFGKVLQNSGIAATVGDMLKDSHLGIWLPFLIAAGIKTAQGSSTVSIITTAGIVAPLLAPLGLDSETARALTVIAIGAGAMVVSHANDSYFWVVTQFSGMSVKQGYKLQTIGTLVEGAAAAVGVWVLSIILL
ncbi:MAG: GntP family permease [Planctomycetes bacterium]|nr:GntP family permease [Planctomycetota bacterium]